MVCYIIGFLTPNVSHRLSFSFKVISDERDTVAFLQTATTDEILSKIANVDDEAAEVKTVVRKEIKLTLVDGRYSGCFTI